MEKVAVLPVPDWAWAITSWPENVISRGSISDNSQVALTLDDGHDGALLDSRRTLEAISVDALTKVSLTPAQRTAEIQAVSYLEATQT